MASWYTEGTVTVTNGGAVVTGAGTKFSNCRSGDMFVGPDSAIYQVINPSSDTAVSISPAYRGATAAGAAYGIVPVNGYPKALADAVNQMVQQWGSTLAGLGTVSTFNTVLVANGGTGATSAASARANLGLGAAAVAAIVGTVSQSGGIATGAIYERGSNGNGEYIKYADGTLLCWHSKLPTLTTATAIGQGYQSVPAARYDFPAAFVGDANSVVVLPQTKYVSGPSQGWCTVSGKALNYANIIALGFHSGIEVHTAYLAIGRWF